MVVSALFAFGSACANSLNLVTQHVASTAAPAKVRGWRLALYLIRNPLWLFGVAAMVGAFVLQALALYNGRLSIVQSILVTELVFTLVIGRLWLRRAVVAAAWVSASITSAGLAAFLAMSQPEGGHPQATAGAWLPALLTFGGAVALLTAFAARGSPVRRAALYATGSGIVWALFATFVKSVTDVLSASSVLAVLERGAIYGLVIAGIVGTVLTQAALHYGPLRVSQPLMVIVNPMVSIVLGVWLFGEHFKGSGWKTFFGAVGFGAMALGVVCLAQTAPSLEASPSATAALSTP
jgi:drug/metabolite transporter (DMT)-like permease